MRRYLLLRSFLALLAPVGSQLVTLAAQAQDAGAAPSADAGAAPAAEAGAPAPSAAPQPEPADGEPAEPGEPASAPPAASPLLEPPALKPLELDPKSAAAAEASKPKSAPPAEKRGWTAPETIFHLHGYLRMRGSLLKDGSLGHRPQYDRLIRGPGTMSDERRMNYDPFPFFIPEDSSNYDPETGDMRAPVEGGCGKNHRAEPGRCDKKTQVGGDMRLRLKPEIHLSDDVRIKAWVDVLDNVGLGTLGYGPNALYGPADPDLGNLIRVRRAWGEARNRDIGELRFGRMGADWGLGILDNGGDRNGIDSDFSSDLDRIMGMTNLAGFYLMAAYDWASQGKVTPGSATPSGVAVDRAQRDDLSALTIAAAHKLEPELQRSNLLRGEAVYNYGLYFIYRRQRLKNREGEIDSAEQPYYRIDQSQFVPDLWFQFLWEGLRIELEAAFVAGSLEGGCPWIRADPDNRDTWREGDEFINVGPTERRSSGECTFRQLGVALESEYRLFDDRLGIHFLSGFASGDAHAYGLAQTNDPSFQRSETSDADRTISTYQFHPDYRVDLILWRTLMRRVAGGYYFKPGISYDFIHDPYGQQAGARVDVIYSRAAQAKQTWGDDANLGLELDLSLYYRSEDGPDVLDGFYTTIQWGILFPFKGLEYANSIVGAPGGSDSAMILRGVLGIAF